MLYTLGYTGWTPQAIRETATTLNAVVCDIRFSPASRHPQWSRKQLSAYLGARYAHLPALGNPNYKNGGPIATANFDTGVERLGPLKTASAFHA